MVGVCTDGAPKLIGDWSGTGPRPFRDWSGYPNLSGPKINKIPRGFGRSEMNTTRHIFKRIHKTFKTTKCTSLLSPHPSSLIRESSLIPQSCMYCVVPRFSTDIYYFFLLFSGLLKFPPSGSRLQSLMLPL